MERVRKFDASDHLKLTTILRQSFSTRSEEKQREHWIAWLYFIQASATKQEISSWIHTDTGMSNKTQEEMQMEPCFPSCFSTVPPFLQLSDGVVRSRVGVGTGHAGVHHQLIALLGVFEVTFGGRARFGHHLGALEEFLGLAERHRVLHPLHALESRRESRSRSNIGGDGWEKAHLADGDDVDVVHGH